MLLLAPAGLRGGLKLEAYHQSRQPQSFFLCGPVFWDFGSLFRTFRGHFLRAVAAAVSSSTSLRRPRLCVATQASRTSHSRCSCSSSQVSRLVSAGVYLSLKDVAASQCVCSRGADDGSISFFRKMFTHLFARSVRPTWEDPPSYHHLQQLKDQQSEEVPGQLFLEGKKQRVVNIVTVAWLATAGLRGGQILEASSSTCCASHTLLPSASAAPPGFKSV